MAEQIDIFNPKGAEQVQRNSEIYKVSFKDAKNGIYKSVIRFIPNVFDPNLNIAQKYVSWVLNPVTKMGKYVDCPSRESGLPSPVSDMYFKLVNTKIAAYEDYAKKHVSSKLQYASLVQIVQDEQHPELVGQIKVFPYGKKIWDKLYYEEHPNAGTGTNPFHPFYGRRFSIVCTAQSGFNNFDQSSFFDEKNGNQIIPSGIWYVNPATNQMEIANENTDQQVLVNYLQSVSPDLTKYNPQPWTDEQTKHVTETLAIIENFITTGSTGSPAQMMQQQNMNVINNIPTTVNPVFPGATVQPTNPVFPGAAMPTQNSGIPVAQPTTVPQAQPAFPNAVPQAAPVMPQTVAVPATPQMPVASPAQPGSVTGVDIPNINPQVAPSAPVKPAGINVDMGDILSQL